jgi:hypothetical protein
MKIPRLRSPGTKRSPRSNTLHTNPQWRESANRLPIGFSSQRVGSDWGMPLAPILSKTPRQSAVCWPEIAKLIPSKSTAFGRETRRASSDPACIPPRNDLTSAAPMEDVKKTHGRAREPAGEAGAERPGIAGVALTSTPPSGATSRRRPPRGGLPNATAFGRGCLLGHNSCNDKGDQQAVAESY